MGVVVVVVVVMSVVVVQRYAYHVHRAPALCDASGLFLP